MNATLIETPNEALARLFSRISDLATLPRLAQRVLELAWDESATNEDLRKIIQQDPGLTAKILQRVNSSFYGLPHRVADLNKAIILLGFREIQAIALTVFLSRLFDHCDSHGTYRREALWHHSVAVAAASRTIARICGLPHPDEAYVAGLLHDIGYMLLDRHLRRHFYAIIDQLTELRPTFDVEREVLTFDHAMLGAFVAERWQFPGQIVNAIGYHHQLPDHPYPHGSLIACVHLADYLCSRSGCSSLGVINVPEFSEAARRHLKLDDISMALIEAELPLALTQAGELASMERLGAA